MKHFIESFKSYFDEGQLLGYDSSLWDFLKTYFFTDTYD